MRNPFSRPSRRSRMAALAAVVVPLALVTTLAPSSTVNAEPAHRDANPLAGRTWGVYKGAQDQAWEPYATTTGRKKRLLGKIALQPRTKWYGSWIPAGQIDDKVRDYVRNAQDGNPNALVQMAFFNLKPWEHDACKSLPTRAQKAGYKAWISSAANGIGNAHVALILQPDGPFALCAPGNSKVYSRLIRYSAKTLGALPNTSVYIDAGASDWLRDDPARAAKILMRGGVQYVRGFALNSTHYVSTSREIRFGTNVAKYLAGRGIPGKHFVINTSSNGRPFAGYTYKGPDFDHAYVCKTKADRRCVTLGIPPTTDVDNPKWGLSAGNRELAAEYVDAYMWFGRPWLYRQADPFDTKRALKLVKTSPF